MNLTEKQFKKLFMENTIEFCAKKLGCHYQTVCNHARKLGLHKHKKHIRINIAKKGRHVCGGSSKPPKRKK